MIDKITSLEELYNLKEVIGEDNYIDIKGDEYLGRNIHLAKNSLFIWIFSEQDVKDFENIFGMLEKVTLNEKYRRTIVAALKAKCREVLSRGVSPIECLLYGSKIINNRILNDRALTDYIAELIFEIYSLKSDSSKEVLMHIIKNWHWIPQLKIVITACGKIKDKELLEQIYRYNSNENLLKFECFKAVIDSGDILLLNYIIETISIIGNEELVDKQIANYFIRSFGNKFPKSCCNELKEVYKNPSITVTAKKTISKVIRSQSTIIEVGKISNMNISQMIEIAKSDKDNHEEVFQILCKYLNENKTRRNAIIACRYTNNFIYGDVILETKKKTKLDFNETKEFILTLAVLKHRDAAKFIGEFMNDERLKNYCRVAYIILGESSYCKDLAYEFLLEEFAIVDQTEKALNQCINSSVNLREELRKQFIQILNEGSEEEKLVALENMKRVIKKVVDKSIDKELFKIVEEHKNKEKKYSEKFQMKVLELIEELISDNNYLNYEGALFSVLESSAFSINIRNKSANILKKISLKQPK